MQGVAGVGIITAGNVRAETARSLVYLTISGIPRWIHIHPAGPYLDDARNAVIRQFNAQAQICDRLLFIDSDIEFKPTDVQQLIDDDLPVVSGVYYNLWSARESHVGLGPTPVVLHWTGETGDRNMVPVTEWPDGPFDGDYSERPVIEVDGVGAGFLMVRRDVLDALEAEHGNPSPWFGEAIYENSHLGEDVDFCVRCQQLGIPVAVDRRVQLGHFKTVCYRGS